MSTNATSIARTAAAAAKRAEKASEDGRAQLAAKSARDAARTAILAARDAILAARDAHDAAEISDQKAASSAARRAAKAQQSAESYALEACAVSIASKQVQGGYTSSEVLAGAVDRSARYLVIRDGRLIASFLDEDDALLFEAELAEIDSARSSEGVVCEVRARRGRRVGGYKLSNGKILPFVK